MPSTYIWWSIFSFFFWCAKIVLIRVWKIGPVHPSIYPSFWVFSWNWIISIFLNSGMMLGTYIKLCVTKPGFWNKGKMGTKYSFLELLKNVVINFFWILFYNESLYYLQYSCTNPIFGKNQVPEIFARMLSGFLNQQYNQNKFMK